MSWKLTRTNLESSFTPVHQVSIHQPSNDIQQPLSLFFNSAFFSSLLHSSSARHLSQWQWIEANLCKALWHLELENVYSELQRHDQQELLSECLRNYLDVEVRIRTRDIAVVLQKAQNNTFGQAIVVDLILDPAGFPLWHFFYLPVHLAMPQRGKTVLTPASKNVNRADQTRKANDLLPDRWPQYDLLETAQTFTRNLFKPQSTDFKPRNCLVTTCLQITLHECPGTTTDSLSEAGS